MFAQCPECLTVFTVSEAQLTVRHGRVRCGECASVFNAAWHLLDELPTDDGTPDAGPQSPAPGVAGDPAPPAKPRDSQTPSPATARSTPDPVPEKPRPADRGATPIAPAASTHATVTPSARTGGGPEPTPKAPPPVASTHATVTPSTRTDGGPEPAPAVSPPFEAPPPPG